MAAGSEPVSHNRSSSCVEGYPEAAAGIIAALLWFLLYRDPERIALDAMEQRYLAEGEPALLVGASVGFVSALIYLFVVRDPITLDA